MPDARRYEPRWPPPAVSSRIVPALTQGGLTRFIEAQAQASGVRLGRGAAQVLAERLGGFIREGDVDRDRLGQMAASEVARAADCTGWTRKSARTTSGRSFPR